MKILSRFIAITLMICILVTGALPAHAEQSLISDPYVHEIKNDLIAAYIDYENGRFLIGSLEGRLDNTFDNYSRYLAESGVPYLYNGRLAKAAGPESSYTTIKIDGVNYIFGNDYTDLVEGAKKVSCRKISETVHETVWEIKDVEVTQRLEMPSDPKDRMAGIVKVSYSVENKSGRDIQFGSRILLDTTVRHADNAAVYISDENGEKKIQKETVIEKEDLPEYWRAQMNYFGSINLESVGILQTEVIDKPDKMVIGHWKGLCSSKWTYYPDEDLNFTVDDNRFGTADGAVALYWEERNLKEGEKFTFSTGYGLGLDAVTKNPARPDLFSYPVEVMLTEDAFDYQSFKVVVAAQNRWVEELKNVKVGLYPSNSLFRPVETREIGLPKGHAGTRSITWDSVEKGEKRWAEITLKVDEKFKEYTVKDFDIFVAYDDPETNEQKYNLYNCKIGIPAITKVPEVTYTMVGPEYFYYQGKRFFTIQGSGFDFLKERISYDPLNIQVVNTKEPYDTIPVYMTSIRNDNLIWFWTERGEGFKEAGEYEVTVSTDRFGTHTFPVKLKPVSYEKYKNRDYGIVTAYREPGGFDYEIKSFNTESDLEEFQAELVEKYNENYYEKDDRYDEKDIWDFMPLIIRGAAFGNDENGFRFTDGTAINGSVIYKTEDTGETSGIRLTKVTTDSGSFLALLGNGKLEVAGTTFIDGEFEIKLTDGANHSLNYEIPSGPDPLDGEIDYGDQFDMPETFPANPVVIEQTKAFYDVIQFINGYPVIINSMMLREDGLSMDGYMGLFLHSSILPNTKVQAGESNRSYIKKKLDNRGSLGGGIDVFDIRYGNVWDEERDRMMPRFKGIRTDVFVAWPKNMIEMIDFGGNVRLMLDTMEESLGVSGTFSFEVIEASGLLNFMLVEGVPVPDDLGFELAGFGIPLVPPTPVLNITRGGGYIYNIATTVKGGIDPKYAVEQDPEDLITAVITGGISDPTSKIISGDPMKLTISPAEISGRGTINIIDIPIVDAILKLEWMGRERDGEMKAKVRATAEGQIEISLVVGEISGAAKVYMGINDIRVNNPLYPIELGGKATVSGSFLGVNLANAYGGISSDYFYARGTLLGLDAGIKYYWKDGKAKLASLNNFDNNSCYACSDCDKDIVIDNFRLLASSRTKRDRSVLMSDMNLAGINSTHHNIPVAEPDNILLKVLYSEDTPEVELLRPDGSLYELNDGENYMVVDSGEEKFIYISVLQPELGTWQLKSDTSVDYELIGVEQLPGINSIAVKKQEGNKVTLSYDTVKGSGKSLKIYFTETNEDTGELIEEISIDEDAGDVEFELPGGINGGKYYLRAELISDGANIDNAYTENTISVENPNTPEPPIGVTAENAGNNNIRVQWNSEDDIIDGFLMGLYDENGKQLNDGAIVVEKGEGAEYEVLVSGVWEEVNAEGDVDREDFMQAGLSQGQPYKVAVTAFNEETTDDGQNIKYESESVYSDTVEFQEANPPTITYNLSNSAGALQEEEVAGEDGFITNEREITIDCSAGQNADIAVYANGEPVKAVSGGSLEETITLNEGNNDLVIKSTNTVGDTAQKVIYVMADTTSPVLMVKNPAQGEIVDGDTITVQGAVEQGSIVQIDGQTVTPDANGIFSTDIGFGDLQKKMVVIQAVDLAGNIAEYEAEVQKNITRKIKRVYVDTDADSLEIGKPVQLKLYAVYDDNSLVQVDNSAVNWSIVQGSSSGAVDENGVLTLYGYSRVYVKADYEIASDFAFQDSKVFEPGGITHDLPEQETPGDNDDNDDDNQKVEKERETVTIDDDTLENYLDTGSSKDMIVISAGETVGENAEEMVASVRDFVLTQNALNKIIELFAETPGEEDGPEGSSEDSRRLYIQTDAATIGIPAEVLKEASDTGLIISVETLDDESCLTALNQKDESMRNTAPVTDFVIKSDDRDIREFKKKVKVEFKLNNADLTGIDTRKLGIYYLDEVRNEWVYVGGKYDPESGSIEAETNHFTKFSVFEYNKSFADTQNSWAKDYIELLAARHITQGIDEYNFGVGQKVTRAQFATFLVRTLGIDTGVYSGNFADCKDGTWYTPFIEAAYKAGLVNGVGNGLFEPNSTITREEMAAMLIRAYKHMNGYEDADQTVENSADFTDMNEVSSWAKDHVNAVQALGLMNGKPDGSFAPKDSALREEVAKVLILLEM